MIQEMFPKAAGPGGEIVKKGIGAAAAGGFVALLSLFNMAGRFAWSSLSDFIGRKNVYIVYLLLGAVLYCLIPMAGHAGSAPLFIGVCAIIISMYGGGFATIPAYLKDLFGSMQVGAIHGRLLTAWSVAGIAGARCSWCNHLRVYLQQRGASGVNLYAPTMYLMAGLLHGRPGVATSRCDAVATRYHHSDHGQPDESAASHSALGSTKSPCPLDMIERTTPPAVTVQLVAYWLVVGLPLIWGVWTTLVKLPALFQ